MNDAAWERLTDAIDVKLGVTKHGREERALEDRPDLQETVEFIEFEQGGRQFRLERATGPAIIDRKTHYSHRPGVANRVENIYDPNEIAHRVTLFQQTAEGLEELNLADLGL
jgi:hypothetical protein